MHTAKNEDHISVIASKFGIQSWETLWNKNKDKLNRASPNMLFKGNKLSVGGDRLDIPTKSEEKESGQTGVFNKFKLKQGELFLRMRILKEGFLPLAGASYELTLDGTGGTFKGKTDANGQFKHPIPPTTTKATLTVRAKAEDTNPPPASGAAPAAGGDDTLHGDVPITWDLRIGALSPVCENAPDQYCVPGVQQRLNNLNINTALIDGINGPNTSAAITSFQEIAEIKDKVAQPGVSDKSPTQEKLRKVHDGSSPVHPKDA
jgi:hypothetical protein